MITKMNHETERSEDITYNCNKSFKHSRCNAHLTSKRSRRAMNMPGMTMSPRPSIAKLLAASPFSSRSCGNTTRTTHNMRPLRFTVKDKFCVSQYCSHHTICKITTAKFFDRHSWRWFSTITSHSTNLYWKHCFVMYATTGHYCIIVLGKTKHVNQSLNHSVASFLVIICTFFMAVNMKQLNFSLNALSSLVCLYM